MKNLFQIYFNETLPIITNKQKLSHIIVLLVSDFIAVHFPLIYL